MKTAVFILVAAALAGCVTQRSEVGNLFAQGSEIIRRDPDKQIAKADAAAAARGYTRHQIKAGEFQLVLRRPKLDKAAEIEIALFGDGINFWQSDNSGRRTYTTPAQNAPDDPGYYFDSAPAGRSIYILERPCFAVTPKTDPKCSDHYWWDRGRYSEPVLVAVSKAIDEAKAMSGARVVHLIGTSSGGTLAVLVAARRDDIASIRTISAALDTEATFKYQAGKYGAAADFVVDGQNPLQVAEKLSRIPQLHIRGKRDELIPQQAWEAFRSRAGNCAAILDGETSHYDADLHDLWRHGFAEPLKRCLP
ncbi:hypothetical protein [Ferrovibrio terrae]|uniref:hypothetical protein n=1 Tax=Ferrovibrio terrae TaxID=2594003 RepID=UPI003137A494